MNHIFKKQLRILLLVFFDNLLVYNKTWEEHLKHVDVILTIMEEHSLFSKKVKCEFGLIKILYLVQVIGVEGVNEHQDKIQNIIDWPTHRTLIDLRGFFGIFLYYRNFVKGIS
jgi:hypothetical protein